MLGSSIRVTSRQKNLLLLKNIYQGPGTMSYFERVVLPSAGLPMKVSYNLTESLKILDCSRSHLFKLNHLGHITITQHKRIYCKDFEQYFSKRLPDPINKKSKK